MDPEQMDDDGQISLKRIVHLDLKGAPPKMSYLLKVIPLLRQWGATGILCEYEDMFPFRDELAVISRKWAYTPDEVRSLQDVAVSEGMKFIPLVQTFGHVEYILKHKEFKHLREVALNPMSLCPTNKNSLPLIESIIDQCVSEHEDLEYLHIGGDEVFCMAACKDCLQACKSMTRNQLYLSHMVPVIKSIQSKYPKLKIMIWDDMFREFSVSDLEQLGNAVIPMVWSYLDDLSEQFPTGMWDRFAAVFDEIWIASSFKGSSGPACDVPPLMHHVNNHRSWLSLVTTFPREILSKIRGIALTGWARYDHFATLCELLPTSLPCLAICLQVLRKKDFSRDLHIEVSKQLGYLQPFFAQSGESMHLDDTCGNFPGSELVMYTSHLDVGKRQLAMAQNRIDGWMDAWHVDVKKEINFGHLDYASSLLNMTVQSYESIRGPLQECLSYHFDEEAVREFMVVKVEAQLKRALDMLAQVRSARTTCGGDDMNT